MFPCVTARYADERCAAVAILSSLGCLHSALGPPSSWRSAAAAGGAARGASPGGQDDGLSEHVLSVASDAAQSVLEVVEAEHALADKHQTRFLMLLARTMARLAELCARLGASAASWPPRREEAPRLARACRLLLSGARSLPALRSYLGLSGTICKAAQVREDGSTRLLVCGHACSLARTATCYAPSVQRCSADLLTRLSLQRRLPDALAAAERLELALFEVARLRHKGSDKASKALKALREYVEDQEHRLRESVLSVSAKVGERALQRAAAPPRKRRRSGPVVRNADVRAARAFAACAARLLIPLFRTSTSMGCCRRRAAAAARRTRAMTTTTSTTGWSISVARSIERAGHVFRNSSHSIGFAIHPSTEKSHQTARVLLNLARHRLARRLVRRRRRLRRHRRRRGRRRRRRRLLRLLCVPGRRLVLAQSLGTSFAACMRVAAGVATVAVSFGEGVALAAACLGARSGVSEPAVVASAAAPQLKVATDVATALAAGATAATATTTITTITATATTAAASTATPTAIVPREVARLGRALREDGQRLGPLRRDRGVRHRELAQRHRSVGGGGQRERYNQRRVLSRAGRGHAPL